MPNHPLAPPLAHRFPDATWDPPEQTLPACSKHEAGGAGRAFCDCIWTMLSLEKPEPHDHCPQDFMYRQVAHLSTFAGCESIKAWAALRLRELQKLVDARARVWGNPHWHEADMARRNESSSGKRRRTDFHVKQRVVGACTKQASIGASAKALGDIPSSVACKWRHSEMAAYRATTLLKLLPQDSLAITIDATRIGKPARELLLGMASCAKSGVHCVLPPQVPSRSTSIEGGVGTNLGVSAIGTRRLPSFGGGIQCVRLRFLSSAAGEG